MLKLQDIMTRDVVSVAPDMTLRDTMTLLTSRHLSGAPVVAGGKLVGVVSATDLLEFAASNPGVPAERPEAEVDEEEEEEWPEATAVEADDVPPAMYFTELWPDAGAETAERFEAVQGPEWDPLEEHTVSEVMTRRVQAMPPDTPVETAADAMRRAGVHRLLVTENGRLLGIVTATDITKAVADHRLTTRRYVFNRDERFDDRGWEQ